MDNRISQIAALANVAAYDEGLTKEYIEGSPHIKHASLRNLYGKLVVEVFDAARKNAAIPKVLDLGAGEGSVTLPFLELGAEVVAVDSSQTQLSKLREKGKRFGSKLTVRCEDVSVTLQKAEEKFDIVVANSFLHHVPDYLDLIRKADAILLPSGQFFSFQDPLAYHTIGSLTSVFGKLAYFSWRVFRGDVAGGLLRRLRRARGVYREDSPHDNAEYHVTRNGVDQNAIQALLESKAYRCRIVHYFSTQSRLFQPVGTALGLNNTFAVIAQKPTS